MPLKGKWLKRLAVILVAIVVLVGAGFYLWARTSTYPAYSDAAALADQARSEQGWYVFEPEGAPTAGFIFYPGGLVDPAAYAPLMQRLSDGGILAIIVPMPLDLAVFGVGNADDVVARYPHIDTWIIGGHSLGGAMACEYIKDGASKIDGLALLASYPADSTDLSDLPIAATSIFGSEDGVAGDVFDQSLQRLPDGTSLKEIQGGNHAQFGDYGPQDGDGVATLSRDEQQRLTAEAILGLIEAIK